MLPPRAGEIPGTIEERKPRTIHRSLVSDNSTFLLNSTVASPSAFRYSRELPSREEWQIDLYRAPCRCLFFPHRYTKTATGHDEEVVCDRHEIESG